MNGRGVGRDAADATRRRVPMLALALLLVGLGIAMADDGGEVRVRSGPGAEATVSIGVGPAVQVEDRTPGAHPATDKAAGHGETFAGEVTFLLRSHRLTRPATVDVADPVVSAIRLFPDADGTMVSIFVRQPVTYSISKPTPAGEVRVRVRGKARPLTITTTARGRQEVKRPEPTGEGEVGLDAESLSYDQQTNTLTARGGVTLTRGDTTLTADEVLYDRANSVAQAKGHVVITDPQATVTGSFAHLNLDDESGWIETADATLEPTGYSLLAGRLEKRGGPRYSVADGVFTTCECGGLERPSWSIAARQTEVQLEGSGVARGATFRVKDVPVLYLPYFVFPVATKRQSGFLLPRLGYSNLRGFQYEQPFYWAIDKSSDATIGVDVETAARVGVAGEYRYALSKRTKGQFTAAYYNDRIGGLESQGPTEEVMPETPENRFLIAGRHVQPFLAGSKLYVDMLAVSDDEFFRDINTLGFVGGGEVAFRTTRFTTSRAEMLKTWRGGLASLQTTYYQDLQDPQDVTVQRLPTAFVEHSLPLWGDRVVARLAGEGSSFWRQEGFDGLRADLAPEVFVPFNLGTWLSGSVTGQLRETAYHLYDREQVAIVVEDPGTALPPERFRTFPRLFEPLDRTYTRELATVQGRVGTTVQRVFDFPYLGLGKIMHTIEPELQYLFVPRTQRFDDSADLGSQTAFVDGYLFDEKDAIRQRNFISYGVVTRVLGRPALPEPVEGVPVAAPADTSAAPPSPKPAAPAGPPRELLRASILHGYDVSRTLVGSSHASDVDFGIHLAPADYLSLTYNTTASFQSQPIVSCGDPSAPTKQCRASNVRGQAVGAVLREPGWTAPAKGHGLQRPSAIGVSYRFVAKDVNQAIGLGPPGSLLFQANGVDEIDGGLYLRLGDYLGFTFLSRYTLDTTQAVNSANQPVTLGPHFLERDYLLRLISRCNCWAIDVGLADKFNPDERLFRIQFTLVGLGSVGPSPGQLNYVGVGPGQPASGHGPGFTGGGFY